MRVQVVDWNVQGGERLYLGRILNQFFGDWNRSKPAKTFLQLKPSSDVKVIAISHRISSINTTILTTTKDEVEVYGFTIRQIPLSRSENYVYPKSNHRLRGSAIRHRFV